MRLSEYRAAALETAVYSERGNNITYPVLGLCGEAGELANKFKKVLRDHQGVADVTQCCEMAEELADVLWYVAAVADELGYSLDEIADINLAKLSSRKARGKISGSGDNR